MIPLCLPGHQPREPAVPAKTPVDWGLLKTVSVLYVEDYDIVREPLAEFLRRRLGTVHTAENGREGLELFKRHKPDIVITDILMPVMGGLEMAEAIKAMDSETPVIVTTAFNEQDFLMKAINIGVDRYVLKPVDGDALVEAIYQVARPMLQRREIQAQALSLGQQAEALRICQAEADFLTGGSRELHALADAALGLAGELAAEPGEPLTPRQKEKAERILDAVRRMERLIEDMLASPRPE
jgi:DNA-binding NarL/FixJ family response regulator